MNVHIAQEKSVFFICAVENTVAAKPTAEKRFCECSSELKQRSSITVSHCRKVIVR